MSFTLPLTVCAATTQFCEVTVIESPGVGAVALASLMLKSRLPLSQAWVVVVSASAFTRSAACVWLRSISLPIARRCTVASNANARVDAAAVKTPPLPVKSARLEKPARVLRAAPSAVPA